MCCCTWNFFGADITYDFEIVARQWTHRRYQKLNEIWWINWDSGGVCVDIDLFQAESRALTTCARRNKFGICWIRHRWKQLKHWNWSTNRQFVSVLSLINIFNRFMCWRERRLGADLIWIRRVRWSLARLHNIKSFLGISNKQVLLFEAWFWLHTTLNVFLIFAFIDFSIGIRVQHF